MGRYRIILESIVFTLEAAGAVAIVVAAAFATGRFLLRRHEPESYLVFRHGLGRGIILGLEFLVAADIIRTVTMAPTLENVAVLGVIVLIRTFLSFVLEVELEGWPPWHRKNERPAGHGPSAKPAPETRSSSE